LTQLDERAMSAELDTRTFTMTFAQPVAIRDLLLVLVRGTSLSVIPDPEISGSFIGELKNVTIRQALTMVLPQLDLDYSLNGSLVRVFRREPETRLFDINYIASLRTGASTIGAVPEGGSTVSIATSTGTGVFDDIVKGVQTLLSERATFNVDRKAGLLQVTDFPERLERVALYLDAVQDRVHRQVQIDARILEVELNDPNAATLDWMALAQETGASKVATVGGAAAARFRIADVSRFMTALGAQGRVSTLATPRLLALNNEPAVVRAVSRPGGENSQEQSVTLGITPQISSDGVVMLSVSPIVRVQRGGAADRPPASGGAHETDMLARVADGETIVVAGLTREQETRERRNSGITGGWFGRSTVVTRKRIELVILLTPRILAPAGAH
jgi:MSHA biogenesis protein MshL